MSYENLPLVWGGFFAPNHATSSAGPATNPLDSSSSPARSCHHMHIAHATFQPPGSTPYTVLAVQSSRHSARSLNVFARLVDWQACPSYDCTCLARKKVGQVAEVNRRLKRGTSRACVRHRACRWQIFAVLAVFKREWHRPIAAWPDRGQKTQVGN